MLKPLNILLIVFLSISCAQKGEGVPTRFSLVSSISSADIAGTVVHAANLSDATQYLFVVGSSDDYFDISPGRYKFSALRWAGDSSVLGEKTLTGSLSCVFGVEGAIDEAKEATVNLNISKANCANGSNSTLVRSSDLYAGEMKKIQLRHCFKKSFQEFRPSGGNYDMCEYSYLGMAQSFIVSILGGELSSPIGGGTPQFSQKGKLSSRCITRDQLSDTKITLPTGTLPIQIEGFKNKDCTGESYQASGPLGITSLSQVDPDSIWIEDVTGSPDLTRIYSNSTFSMESCPAGFLKVSGSQLLGTSDFCVMQNELTVSLEMGPRTSSDNGFSSISSFTELKDACTSLGPNYNILSNSEWMTMAHQIEENLVNRYDQLRIPSGNYGSAGEDIWEVPVDSYLEDLRNPYNQDTQFGKTTRILYLENGQVIWDLAGNYNEIVDFKNTRDQPLKTVADTARSTWKYLKDYDFDSIAGTDLSNIDVRPLGDFTHNTNAAGILDPTKTVAPDYLGYIGRGNVTATQGWGLSLGLYNLTVYADSYSKDYITTRCVYRE